MRSPVVQSDRQTVTHIYFLLTRGQIGRFHRVAHDEIWNFYEGSPLRLVTFDGSKAREQQLGSRNGYAGIVEGGLFQGAESTGEYRLAGCTVAPGFDFADFSFLADRPADREKRERNAPAYLHFL